MLNKYQFEVLKLSLDSDQLTQRHIARSCDVSVGSVNKAIKSLKDAGCLTDAGKVTNTGLKELEPYKVDNAIILAAGVATRMAPLSFEKPKALFEVNGEVLIERLIRQLHEADINNIIIVVGHMKESFFYLSAKFGVQLVVNPEYASKNNYASIWHAKEYLGNSYILPTDQYYERNPFQKYVFEPYCAAVESPQGTTVRALICDDKNYIVGFDMKPGCFMRGPAYFDRHFSKSFLEIINKEKDLPETFQKWWHVIFLEHAKELRMRMIKWDNSDVFEFDRMQDLVQFDSDFLINVDSKILDNICSTLDCARSDISDVKPLKEGLTNLSVLFSCKGEKYVYRHPGLGSNEIVNREAETFSLNVAKELGLDDTFVFEDPKTGWKISRFIEGCVPFDYTNTKHVKKALSMAKTLHECDRVSPWTFDFYAEGLKLVQLLNDMGYHLPPDFDKLLPTVSTLSEMMQSDMDKAVLCHNDFYGPNLLVRGDEMWLIDWEYSAMGDWACDIGNFVAQGSGFSIEETIDALSLYFGRDASQIEIRHCIAAVGVVGWYWYVWAIYKEAMGNSVGEWMLTWYNAAELYSSTALDMYREK